ncbi:MAG: cobalamin biosynthesis protein [Gammaproteobacteria bacterium]|nr:cobalamin biosynthesis protein [Gammaproteobacteria bacterium]
MIKIIALTEAGLVLANKLDQTFKQPSDKNRDEHSAENNAEKSAEKSEVLYKPTPFADTVQQAFKAGDALIFICATGIVMRTLAPVLESKLSDPPVLVLDEAGEFVIPLLSGHQGGANEWAAQVAKQLKSQLVITTANPYLAPVYSVGMGCERGCSIDDLQTLLAQCLEQANLNLSQITHINSIDIKRDEVGLIELAKRIDKPFLTWDIEQLSSVEHLLSTKSDYIFSVVGVYGVAESAALVDVIKQTGQAGELVLNKQKSATATCAIARSYPIVKRSYE